MFCEKCFELNEFPENTGSRDAFKASNLTMSTYLIRCVGNYIWMQNLIVNRNSHHIGVHKALNQH